MSKELKQQPNERQKEKLKELNKTMSKEIENLLNAELFPANLIHPKMGDWLKLALPHETAKSMGVPKPDFYKFWQSMTSKPIEEYSIWEMGFAINCLDCKSMTQLQCETTADYLQLQETVDQMGIIWNEHVNQIKEPITKRYTHMEGQIMANKPVFMPNKKTSSDGSK